MRIAAAILLDREIGQPPVFRPEPSFMKEAVCGIHGLRHRQTLSLVQKRPERVQSIPRERSQDLPDQFVLLPGAGSVREPTHQ